MTSIAFLLIVLTLSMLVTRVAAMALMLTGMSRDAAKFQARSAFTGVGFTTTEAENVVGHPVRRQIVMMLMLIGNLGIGVVVATMIVSFAKTAESENRWLIMTFLFVGLTLLWLAARSRRIERHLNRVISWSLRKWGKLEVRDYVAILQLEGGYAVSELLVESGDWIADKTLIELRLPQEGVLVLGIRRAEGAFLGTPTGEMEVRVGDTLMLYGHVERIEELDGRRSGRQGDQARRAAVAEYEEELEEQETIDDEIEMKRQQEE